MSLLRRLLPTFRGSQAPRPRRLLIEQLPTRDLPSVGGGFTGGGILGSYFDNTNFSGQPSFTRTDVRIDFDWKSAAPGGSNSGDYQEVGKDNFSVRWVGEIIPRFSETYTFHTTSDDRVRVWIKPTNSSQWDLLIDNWAVHGATDDTATADLVAGRTYDIKMEYVEHDGDALARLAWSSLSTPEEIIEPMNNIGVNAVTYDYHTYADAMKSGRAEWGQTEDYFNRPMAAVDENNWPRQDASKILWEGEDPTTMSGTYRLQFTGKAEVTSWYKSGTFWANGRRYGNTLPAGAGYDAATNTTTATIVIGDDADLFALDFRKTQRNSSSGTNTGITDVKLMRPIAEGSSTPHGFDEIYSRELKDAYGRFTTERWLTANFNAEKNWSDRKLPTSQKAAWGDRTGVWEYQVMLANETGKDLYITIPINATDDYVRKLANLLRYGSDGTNPYTSRVDNPKFPPLNPNLRVYVEWANETWNWAFSQATMGVEAARDAVRNNTEDGRIMNYDGKASDGDFRRWTAVRTVKASEIFRSVWSDEAMGSNVRVVLEYQYANAQDTALSALRFIDNYFNNADGKQHVSDPKPVSYYIWGAGGASYYGAENPHGIVNDIVVPDGSFESAALMPGTARANAYSTNWKIEGTAGIFRNQNNRATNDNQQMGGSIGSVPVTGDGQQALYISGKGSATVSVYFPRSGTYALDFMAAIRDGAGNPLDFYIGDKKVTPDGPDSIQAGNPWTPGDGWLRDNKDFQNYGTIPVTINKAGWQTIRIVGRGKDTQTSVVDNFKVASLDAIFDSRLPGGGEAAGQVSISDYQQQLNNQATYAQAYGLNVVAYEGGWSLGGDFGRVPIQAYAKYVDSRASQAHGEAMDAFFKSGGALNILGTYDQWRKGDEKDAAKYPLVKAIDQEGQTLTPEATNGKVVPGTLSVADRSLDSSNGRNESGRLDTSDWISWNIIVPNTADYSLQVTAGEGGTARVIVDGYTLAEGASNSTLGDTVRLTQGLHTIRLQSIGGSFSASQAVVRLVARPVTDNPSTETPTETPNQGTGSSTTGLPSGWAQQDVGGPSQRGGTQVTDDQWTVRGAGANIWGASDEFQFASKDVTGNTVMSARVDSLDNTHGWAKAGLMIRNGTGANAAFAGVFYTPENGILLQWRTTPRGAPLEVSVPLSTSGPVWLRLTRVGNSFYAFYSTNGSVWMRVGSAETIVMPNTLEAGLAVTSHDVNKIATAKFSQVKVED